jgi:pilus assembly protein FimV
MGIVGHLGAVHFRELIRTSALQGVAAMLLCLLPGAAAALGVGEIEVSSGLNQPFDAKIALIGAKPEELVDISARLADKEVFERAGLTRPYSLSALEFVVVSAGDGSGYIHVTSRNGIREPALELIVEVKWRTGSLRRKYSVLLERK